MFLLCSSLGTHQTAQQRTGSYSVRVILPGLPVLTFSVKLLPPPSNSCCCASARAWPARGSGPPEFHLWRACVTGSVCVRACVCARALHEHTEIVQTNSGGPGLCCGVKSAARLHGAVGRRAQPSEPNCM